MKKLFVLLLMVTMVSGAVFASNSVATLNVSTNVPSAFLLRFTAGSGGGQSQTASPVLTVVDINDAEFGKLLLGQEISLGKSLELLAVTGWKIEATGNPLVHASNPNRIITYTVKQYDGIDFPGVGANFAQGLGTVASGGWTGNMPIIIQNLGYTDNGTPSNFPADGMYNGSIVFTISSN